MHFNIPAEHKHASGVYIIRNTVNSKVYVGSTKSFKRRYREHFKALKTGKGSIRLQRFVLKYGIDSLLFELLEIVPLIKEQLLSTEQRWLDLMRPFESNKGFNILPTAGSCLGHKFTEERKARDRAARKPMSLERRAAVSAVHTGRHVSKETRAKISAARRGTKANLNEQQREKVLAGLAARLKPEAEARRKAGFEAYYDKLRAESLLAELACPNCGITFFRKPYVKRTFCSRYCASQARSSKLS